MIKLIRFLTCTDAATLSSFIYFESVFFFSSSSFNMPSESVWWPSALYGYNCHSIDDDKKKYQRTHGEAVDTEAGHDRDNRRICYRNVEIIIIKITISIINYPKFVLYCLNVTFAI